MFKEQNDHGTWQSHFSLYIEDEKNIIRPLVSSLHNCNADGTTTPIILRSRTDRQTFTNKELRNLTVAQTVEPPDEISDIGVSMKRDLSSEKDL